MSVHLPEVVTDTGFNSAAAALGDGWVTVWQGWAEDDEESIYMLRYGADGTAIGEAQLVNSITTGSQISPSITALSGGGYVVAWQTYDTGTSHYQIAYQVYDGTGTKVGSEHDMTSSNETTQPAITATDDGGFMMAWNESTDVYFAKFNDTGAEQGSVSLANYQGTGQQQDASIAELSSGGWVVAWETEYGLALRHFRADGQTSGNDVDIAGTDADSSNVHLTALTGGGFLAAWQTSSTYFESDIRAQRFDAEGTAVGDGFQVNSTTTGHQTDPSITALANGGWVITYIDVEGAGSQDGKVEQTVYDAEGKVIVDEMQFSVPPEFSTRVLEDPNVAAIADGGWIVTWHGHGADGTPYVWEQRFQADGRVYGANNAPSGSNGSIVLDQRGSHTFRAADFGFSDSDGNNLAGVIVKSPPKGQLLLDGTAVAAGTEILVADIGKLVWIPPAKLHGDDVAHLRFRVVDDGGTYGGGEDTSTGASTLSFDVRAPIIGDKSNNRLKGTNDHDVIDGRGGDDTLIGRGGSDTFVFGHKYARDTITDFKTTGKNHDVIDLSGLSDEIKSFKDLIAHHVTDHNGTALINAGNGDVLVLRHVDSDHLVRADFHF